MPKLKEKIDSLPPDLKKEVDDFVNFLINQNKIESQKPKFDWAGSLKNLKEKYTSVELQHKISKLRSGEK